ncbi:hypothetical protein VNI00_017918 [Paramarasmius palmivorus]|uniref:Uncharacterized protein n=1 Tax=Paramarasmius palmivorus TaxID=297713 RepID=A0AAW0B369_9AGAR
MRAQAQAHIGSIPGSRHAPRRASSTAPAPAIDEPPLTTPSVAFQPPDITLTTYPIQATELQSEHGSASSLTAGTGDDVQEVQRTTVTIHVSQSPPYPQTEPAPCVELVEEQAIAIEHQTFDTRQALSALTPTSGLREQTLEETQGMASHAHDLRASIPTPALHPEASRSPSRPQNTSSFSFERHWSRTPPKFGAI